MKVCVIHVFITESCVIDHVKWTDPQSKTAVTYVFRTHLSELLTARYIGRFLFSAQLIIGILAIFNYNNIYYESFNINVTNSKNSSCGFNLVILKEVAHIK